MLPTPEPLLEADKIQARIAELGAEITRDYQGKDLLCVGVLKGSILFFVDLIRKINLPIRTDFICVSSYGDSTTSSGVVKLVLDLGQSIENQHVLLIEDIIETGRTLDYLLENLKTRRPASLKVCSLLVRPKNHDHEMHVDYTGFEIGGDFVIGYGLDYREKYRNIDYVAVMPEELKE